VIELNEKLEETCDLCVPALVEIFRKHKSVATIKVFGWHQYCFNLQQSFHGKDRFVSNF